MQATRQGELHRCLARSRSRASWFETRLQLMDRLMSATSSGAKSKLFGFLKGLFQKPGAEGAPIEEQAVNELPPPPPPQPGPAAAAARSAADKSAAAKSGRNGNSNGGAAHRGVASVSISLSSILNVLPADLRSKIKQSDVGHLTVSIPLEKVLSQLSQGAVKVPFGDIRQAAPQVFAAGVESDRIAVLLPLNEILTQLNPALLVRRPAQKQVEVPSDISSPFDAKGQGLVFSVGNAKPVTPAAPRQAVPAPAVPARGAISSVPTATPPATRPPIPTPKTTAAPDTSPIPFDLFTPKAPQAPKTP